MTTIHINPIKGYQVFSKVFSSGKKLRAYPLLASVVFDISEIGLTPFRFEKMNLPTEIFLGVTVSKRVAKRAVIRNRIKRLMRESVRLVLKDYEENGIELTCKAICLAWQKAPQKPSEISLHDVLPKVQTILRKFTNTQENN